MSCSFPEAASHLAPPLVHTGCYHGRKTWSPALVKPNPLSSLCPSAVTSARTTAQPPCSLHTADRDLFQTQVTLQPCLELSRGFPWI